MAGLEQGCAGEALPRFGHQCPAQHPRTAENSLWAAETELEGEGFKASLQCLPLMFLLLSNRKTEAAETAEMWTWVSNAQVKPQKSTLNFRQYQTSGSTDQNQGS